MDSVAQQVLMGGEKSTPPGQQIFTEASTNWTVPAGVTSISVVAVGKGGSYNDWDGDGIYHGGGGGALAYVNNIPVTPGETLLVSISTASMVVRPASSTTLVAAGSGNGSLAGEVMVGTGGNGGNGSSATLYSSGGSGGAGGYSGKGGNAGQAGVGGGGSGSGGTSGLYGGGVGLFGEGASGAAPALLYVPGNPGSGGSVFTYGGGGSGPGAVRIIWPGDLRQFPSTRTTDE